MLFLPVLLYRRHRPADRRLRQRLTWSRRCGTGSPISSPGCSSTAAREVALRPADRRRRGSARPVFVLTYTAAGDPGWLGDRDGVLGAHLLFRTAYAGVNVPYLAMSARISPDPGDRAFVAGMRMLFGTAAAVTVALVHSARRPVADGIERGAGLFRRGGAVRGCRRRDLGAWSARPIAKAAQPRAPAARQASLRALSLARNRAFVALNAAMMAMIVAITVLNKSVLYYFKYLLERSRRGSARACVDGTGQRRSRFRCGCCSAAMSGCAPCG